MNTASETASVTSNAIGEHRVRQPSFDEVMAELMLQMAIRDISRKADARRPQPIRAARKQASIG